MSTATLAKYLLKELAVPDYSYSNILFSLFFSTYSLVLKYFPEKIYQNKILFLIMLMKDLCTAGFLCGLPFIF